MRHLLTWITAVVLAASPLHAAEDDSLEQRPEIEVLLEAKPAAERRAPEFDDERAGERRRMVRSQIQRQGVTDQRVLEAMRAVPRHQFVPTDERSRAYEDRPLPIGHGQTISQPFIVGFMSGQLDLEPGDRVLEVGTGSAYQAAVLAAMGVEVVSIEIIEPLARAAAQRLDRLGFDNVTVIHGDGYYGFAEHDPYDAIIVTAAAEHVPPPLIDQLKPGRPMVIPVGRSGWTQNLLRVDKRDDGSTRSQTLMPVRFVPLTGEH